MIKKEKIVTDRLVLKNLTDNDKSEMISIVKDPKVYATYMLPDLNNEEEETKLFNRLRNLCSAKDHFVYGIYLNNIVIGFLNDVEKSEDGIEIGYFISSKHWGNGYATEAFKAVIQELFKMGYQKVYAGHFENNPASGRVMQKCGMSLMDRPETIAYRGVNHRIIYYQILNQIK